MINLLLAVFDGAISGKCYIEKYGRLATTVRQSGGGVTRRYPVACGMVDDCEELTTHLTELLPDDSKKGVAFWKQQGPIIIGPADVSSKRRLRTATVDLDLMVWVNLKKVSGDQDHTNWCTMPELITLDLYNTLDCLRDKMTTGMTYLTTLGLEVTRVGTAVQWKQGMNEYNVDNIDMLTIWPFTGFTITVHLSWLVNTACIPAFGCYTCGDEVSVVAYIDQENICTGGTVELSADVTGSTDNVFQWQELIDAAWVDIDGATSNPYTTEELEGAEGVVHTFRVRVDSCGDCTTYSDTVAVTMNDHPDVYIAADPLEIDISFFTTITSEVVGGLGGNNYQWQYLNGATWGDLEGETGASFQMVGMQYGIGAWQFRLVVTQDDGCTGTSAAITITVTG